MQRNLNNRTQLAELLETAIARHQPPGGPPPSDEQLALLASGQLDLLPPDERERLLRYVAATPDEAQLLASMPPPFGESKSDRPGIFKIATYIAWGMAACATVGLGTWHALGDSHAPPTQRVEQAPGESRDPMFNLSEVRTNHQSGTPSHESTDTQNHQPANDRQSELAEIDRVRDDSLLFSAIATGLLSIPVAWMLTASWRRHGEHA